MRELEFDLAPPVRRKYTPAQRQALLNARKKRKAQRRRNQCIFLGVCALVLILLLVGVIKLIGLAFSALRTVEWPAISMPSSFSVEQLLESSSVSSQSSVTYLAPSYDVSDYVYDADDPRLVLVNANLPIGDDYIVETAVADDATGVTLETEAAESYRAMASAASADGIALVLMAGYHSAEEQQEIFDEWQAYYIAEGYDETEAYDLACTLVAQANSSEHLTGYGADIFSADYTDKDLGFADTDAFAWLSAYAAEYGFILRYPEDKQMITGIAYQPWHWRYVGIDNAKAIVESGLSLEEFIEANGTG